MPVPEHRAWLCGEDRESGRSYEHLRRWLEDRIDELTEIDVRCAQCRDLREGCRSGPTGALAHSVDAAIWHADRNVGCRSVALGSCRAQRWRSKFQRWKSEVQLPMSPIQRWTPPIRVWVTRYPTLDRRGRRLGIAAPNVGPVRAAFGNRGTQRWTAAVGVWVTRYPTLDRRGRRLGDTVPNVGPPWSAFGYRGTQRWAAAVGVWESRHPTLSRCGRCLGIAAPNVGPPRSAFG